MPNNTYFKLLTINTYDSALIKLALFNLDFSLLKIIRSTYKDIVQYFPTQVLRKLNNIFLLLLYKLPFSHLSTSNQHKRVCPITIRVCKPIDQLQQIINYSELRFLTD